VNDCTKCENYKAGAVFCLSNFMQQPYPLRDYPWTCIHYTAPTLATLARLATNPPKQTPNAQARLVDGLKPENQPEKPQKDLVSGDLTLES
jgi:hypothetical protein